MTKIPPPAASAAASAFAVPAPQDSPQVDFDRKTSMTSHQIEAVGDRCLLVRLGDKAGIETSRTVHAVVALLQKKLTTGIVEIVPAFTTVAVHYQPLAFPRGRGPASRQLAKQIETLLARGVEPLADSGRLVEIPACYGGEFGPDLDDVARQVDLSPEEVVAIHASLPLTVYAFFFSPGNPFAGPVDPRLQVPRRKSPRTLVPAGSVAIANGITSIYQSASPGGWNLIARTPWNLFDIHASPPTRLQLADRLVFKPVDEAQFAALLEPRP
jgi:inhibitor of KinA